MKLYSKNELKSSRIFFDKQPPMFFTILIVSILVALIISLWVCTILPKNYIVQAQGSVTTQDNTYVGALADGIVLDIKAYEGNQVNEGDVLFTLSNGSEGVQLQALLNQEMQAKEKLKAMDAFDSSLNKGVNLLANNGYQQEYYAKMEYYTSLLRDEKKNASSQQVEMQKKEIKLRDKKANVASLEREYANLKDKTVDNKPEVPEGNTVDTSAKKEELKSKIEALKTEIETLESEITQAAQQGQSQAKQSKLQLLSELGAAKTALKTTLSELEGQISVYKTQDALTEVKAKKSGYVHYLTPIKNGMTIQKAQTIAEISENKENQMLVEAYIQATERSKVNVGDEVKVEIQGVNTQKYGTLAGTLEEIDQGTLTQESQNGNVVLYKCKISIKDKELVTSKGEVIKVLKSMPVTARIVYEKETYMEWILDMLNFKN